MTGGDDEFDDFLARRRRIFRRAEDDVLEPPDDVDRLVLRQAREAIETRRGPREIRGMSWGMPLALAASLLVVFTILLNVGMTKKEPVAQVTVEQVAQRREVPGGPGLVSQDEASLHTPASAPASASVAANDRGAAKPEQTPAWRRDSASWLAEIQRLRTEGKTAEAEAELAEYQRQHRAYAGSPDR